MVFQTKGLGFGSLGGCSFCFLLAFTSCLLLSFSTCLLLALILSVFFFASLDERRIVDIIIMILLSYEIALGRA